MTRCQSEVLDTASLPTSAGSGSCGDQASPSCHGAVSSVDPRCHLKAQCRREPHFLFHSPSLASPNPTCPGSELTAGPATSSDSSPRLKGCLSFHSALDFLFLHPHCMCFPGWEELRSPPADSDGFHRPSVFDSLCSREDHHFLTSHSLLTNVPFHTFAPSSLIAELVPCRPSPPPESLLLCLVGPGWTADAGGTNHVLCLHFVFELRRLRLGSGGHIEPWSVGERMFHREEYADTSVLFTSVLPPSLVLPHSRH